MPPNCFVVVPTYNERENIAPLVAAILEQGSHLKVIVVDDNSPDGTGRLVDALAQADARVHGVHRPAKLGLGTAHVAGMRLALALGASNVVTMDADWSHHPRYLPALLGALAYVDVAIGSRYVEGGGTQYCTAPRRALSRGANLLARAMLKLQARDATAGFRAYRRAVLESIPLGEIRSNGYSFLIEVLHACQSNGFRVGEVPIVFENRQRGSSKISKAEVLRALQTVVRLSARRT